MKGVITNTPHTLTRIIAGTALSGAVAAAGLTVAATAQADPNDHCSTRTGCYHGPGMRWCPGDYVWPGLVVTGWDLSVCHAYHATFNDNNDPIGIAEGPGPPLISIPTTTRQCRPISFLFP